MKCALCVRCTFKREEVLFCTYRSMYRSVEGRLHVGSLTSALRFHSHVFLVWQWKTLSSKHIFYLQTVKKVSKENTLWNPGLSHELSLCTSYNLPQWITEQVKKGASGESLPTVIYSDESALERHIF